ncbi:hypothetical protein CBS101457_002173 [Exobasidium rhododendri]|nr:hypothetical protein CBS101457_002173 [Exobasidium rhododendri]
MAIGNARPPQASSHGMSMPVQQPHQGTLAPGTRVMIGQIVVTVQKYLSQGGFAHVYLVTTDKPIAMPVSDTSLPGSGSSTTRDETLHVLKRMAVPDKEALASVRSEVDVHKSLRNHPNIVHFIEASATSLAGGGYEIFILMEYCSGGGIIDLMNSRLRNRLTEAEVLKIFGDVATGLSVMHHMDPPLLHRDLKVENILLAPPPRSNPSVGPTYKLCDFGSTIPILSRRAPKSLDEVKRLEADLNKHTTLQYRAPEMVDVFQRRVIDEKADVWAMGVFLYKLCYYTTPFEENGGGPLAILNAQYRFPPMPAYSQRIKDLIASMLQEQSASRPTIDQVILGIHRILGTSPPASAMHYANLSAKGRQMRALPSVVSSSGPLSGSASDVAAKAMAQRSRNGENVAGGIDQDLIKVGPSVIEQKRAEEEEVKQRNENITPMRRGRPNRGTNASPTRAAMSPPSEPATSSQQPSFGFADSFSPPTSIINTDLSAPAPPSRSGSAARRSPLMPGVDASSRVSPLPKSVPSPSTTSQQPSQDEEASSRFPSVEELDLQYGGGSSSSKSSTRPPSSSSRAPNAASSPSFSAAAPTNVSLPKSQSRMNLIPGLSERAPVSAMAGKFGKLSGPSPANGHSAPSAVSSGATGKWTGANSSASSLAKRWPYEEMERKQSKENELRAKESPPPPILPSRKAQLKDWLMDDDEKKGTVVSTPSARSPQLSVPSLAGGSAAIEIEAEEADSSEDERGKPEDVNGSVSISGKRQSLMGKSLFEERSKAAIDRNSSWIKPSPAMTSMASSKAKKPEWIDQERQEERGVTLLPSSSLGSSSDAAASPATVAEEGQRAANGTLDSSNTTATAPAWDEDDEEMHFLPPPNLNNDQQYEQEKSSPLIRISTENLKAKSYVDASTSPGRGTPTLLAPTSFTLPTTPTSAARIAPAVAKDQKPINYISPKPTRSPSSKDVDGLMNKYKEFAMNKSEDSSTYDSSSSGADHVTDVSITPRALREARIDDINDVSRKQHSLHNDNRNKTVYNRPSSIAPPPIASSKPNTWSRKDGNESHPKPRGETLKPWEREAAEKEQVDRYGSLRISSPSKGIPERPDEQETTKGNQEAQDRFTGVSSLISQWQSNSTKGAPGWGTVGGRDSSGPAGRMKMKGGEDMLRRSSTITTGSGARGGLVQGRLPSRDV